MLKWFWYKVDSQRYERWYVDKKIAKCAVATQCIDTGFHILHRQGLKFDHGNEKDST